MADKKNAPEAAQENGGRTKARFTKEQLLGAERFRERRDILSALLEPGKGYTVEAAEEKIANYMKGKVR